MFKNFLKHPLGSLLNRESAMLTPFPFASEALNTSNLPGDRLAHIAVQSARSTMGQTTWEQPESSFTVRHS